jgi:hypothetical protein
MCISGHLYDEYERIKEVASKAHVPIVRSGSVPSRLSQFTVARPNYAASINSNKVAKPNSFGRTYFNQVELVDTQLNYEDEHDSEQGGLEINSSCRTNDIDACIAPVSSYVLN